MEVYALIGTAGTGKSHRASLLASAYGISHVIDDGLLIAGARIVAGMSAKKEDSRMAAVRRAIFAEPSHAEDVRAALAADRPERVLILGTSRHMVDLITDALDLPRPDKVIDIREIASPEEIRRARRIRRLEGKHVIPAPTFEVRKSFSGYLVDPLRLFRRGGRQEEQVIEKSMVRPTFSGLGKFFIADTVIGAISERAAREVAEVVGAQRAVVEVDPAGVRVAVDVAVRFGAYLPDALAAAQTAIAAAIERMTALNVVAVDVVARRVAVGTAGEADAAGEAAEAGGGAGAAAEAREAVEAREAAGAGGGAGEAAEAREAAEAGGGAGEAAEAREAVEAREAAEAGGGAGEAAEAREAAEAGGGAGAQEAAEAGAPVDGTQGAHQAGGGEAAGAVHGGRARRRAAAGGTRGRAEEGTAGASEGTVAAGGRRDVDGGKAGRPAAGPGAGDAGTARGAGLESGNRDQQRPASRSARPDDRAR